MTETGRDETWLDMRDSSDIVTTSHVKSYQSVKSPMG